MDLESRKKSSQPASLSTSPKAPSREKEKKIGGGEPIGGAFSSQQPPKVVITTKQIKSNNVTSIQVGRHRSYDNTSSYQIISTDNNKNNNNKNHFGHQLNALQYIENQQLQQPKKSHTFVCGVNEIDESSDKDERERMLVCAGGDELSSSQNRMSQYLQPDKSLVMYEDSTFNSVVRGQTRASYAFSENDADDDDDDEDDDDDYDDDDCQSPSAQSPLVVADIQILTSSSSSSPSKKNSIQETITTRKASNKTDTTSAILKSTAKKISFKDKEKSNNLLDFNVLETNNL